MAVNLIVPPLQTESPIAVAVGSGFTVTLVVAMAVQPFASVTVTWYVPPLIAAALAVTSGFLVLAVKPFAPDQT